MARGTMTRPCNLPKFRASVTLVEVLVVLGLVGLLASLLLPAVQKARDAADRSRCGNNLRQVALGLQSYQAAYTVYPMACGLPNYQGLALRSSILDFKQYSAFTQLLPYLDQISLYNAINFEAGLDDFYLFPKPERGFAANLTAMATRLDVLLCPADGGGNGGAPTGGTNYRVNLGADRWPTLQEGPSNGTLMSYRCASPASITDGLSHTAAFSEKLRCRAESTRIDPRTDMIVGGLGLPHTAAESMAACESQPGAPRGSFSATGLSWFVGTLSQTCYNHVIEPNGRVPDCVMGGYQSGLRPLRSAERPFRRR